MNKPGILLLCISILFLSSGCIGPGLQTPGEAVKSFVYAVAALDADSAKQFVIESMQAKIVADLTTAKTLGVKIEVLEFNVLNETITDNKAIVKFRVKSRLTEPSKEPREEETVKLVNLMRINETWKISSEFYSEKEAVTVGIIGDMTANANTQIKSVLFKQVLDEEGAKYGIYTQPIVLGALEFPREKLLAKFDAVIVTGVANLTYGARDAIGNYVNDGGKVILIGDAGTKDPKDPLILGWSEASLGDNAPVRLNIVGPATTVPTKTINNAILNIYGEHPVLHDYAELYQLNLTEIDSAKCRGITAVDAIPRIGGEDTIAILSSATDSTQYALGIIEKKAGLLGQGKVLYFNYDPGCTRGIAFAIIRYSSGRL